MPQRIVVLGASGYIGQHLVQALSQQGHQVLAVARRIERLDKQQLPNVSCHKVDLNWPTQLASLLTNVDTVYYLVHGMGEGGDFIAHERQVALNVRDALRETPVGQLIFSAPCRHRNTSSLTTCGRGRSPPIPCASLAYR